MKTSVLSLAFGRFSLRVLSGFFSYLQIFYRFVPLVVEGGSLGGSSTLLLSQNRRSSSSFGSKLSSNVGNEPSSHIAVLENERPFKEQSSHPMVFKPADLLPAALNFHPQLAASKDLVGLFQSSRTVSTSSKETPMDARLHSVKSLMKIPAGDLLQLAHRLLDMAARPNRTRPARKWPINRDRHDPIDELRMSKLSLKGTPDLGSLSEDGKSAPITTRQRTAKMSRSSSSSTPPRSCNFSSTTSDTGAASSSGSSSHDAGPSCMNSAYSKTSTPGSSRLIPRMNPLIPQINLHLLTLHDIEWECNRRIQNLHDVVELNDNPEMEWPRYCLVEQIRDELRQIEFDHRKGNSVVEQHGSVVEQNTCEESHTLLGASGDSVHTLNAEIPNRNADTLGIDDDAEVEMQERYNDMIGTRRLRLHYPSIMKLTALQQLDKNGMWPFNKYGCRMDNKGFVKKIFHYVIADFLSDREKFSEISDETWRNLFLALKDIGAEVDIPCCGTGSSGGSGCRCGKCSTIDSCGFHEGDTSERIQTDDGDSSMADADSSEFPFDDLDFYCCGNTPLYEALLASKPAFVSALLEAGADPQAGGIPLLLMESGFPSISEDGHPECTVQSLLDVLSNPNGFPGRADIIGRPVADPVPFRMLPSWHGPFAVAIMNGAGCWYIKLLLEAGAIPNFRMSNGLTPLAYTLGKAKQACRGPLYMYFLQIAKLLIEYGSTGRHDLMGTDMQHVYLQFLLQSFPHHIDLSRSSFCDPASHHAQLFRSRSWSS